MADVITITEAQREGARIVLGISGISGSGKTLTALLLAYGMTNGDGSKVGFLDTENRRGSLYADADTYQLVQDSLGLAKMPGPFRVGNLDAPFSPQRYIDAILAFQKAGVEVLVIDSVSHEWNGLGGVLDIVDSFEKSITGWKKGKPEHKRFMNVLLQSNMHIIVCIRASHKTDWKDPKNPKSLGIMPVQQEEFMFEMTASMMMWDEGKQQETLKCPAALRPILGRHEGYITAADGRALREWVDGAKHLDPAIEAARNTLRTICETGIDAYRAAWSKTPKKIRDALMADGSHETMKASAEAFDKARAQAQPGGEELADLNRDVMGEDAAE